MILYDKSEEELNAEAFELLAQTDITNAKPGSRARTILMIINRILRSYYSALDLNLTMAFVSKAKGQFLDEIGLLLNCPRYPGEDDENYRYRITNQVLVAEGANETAIRLKALSVEHVADVKLNKWTFGTGSFSVHVIPDSYNNIDETVRAVQAVLDETEAYGIKGVALAPRTLSVSMWLTLSFDSSLSQATKIDVSYDIKRAVKNYIDSLSMGEEMILSSIIQTAMNTAGGRIKDIAISRIEVNGKPVLISNYRPYWDEKLYVADEEDIYVA